MPLIQAQGLWVDPIRLRYGADRVAFLFPLLHPIGFPQDMRAERLPKRMLIYESCFVKFPITDLFPIELLEEYPAPVGNT